ncbi:hypothetical protein ACIBHX_16655 [Nonomuraea sp. NPDC050536]|uniref:hypothetical protein n=1 Tax=Nonomuraea sp. NPDC050536 TaxID=3364366 RepID=UPI0037C69F51
MTTSLTDQRSRARLIAELYDRHATGLFAYCADQLGDPGSAADALVAVLAGVPAVPPPRAALYACARREIQRRDIVYSPPVVDPLVDPASALVERTLRELRPHQREVLLLCEVCRLDRAELAWVLDVAPDTAEELAISAAHRFRQTLATALAYTGARVPEPVADVYGALEVAPLRDVLGRLPWPAPPASLRVYFAGSRTAPAAPLFVKPLWPVPPRWPLPLGEADPATSTGIFPAHLLAKVHDRPAPEVHDYSAPDVSDRDHEATTAPMPRLRHPIARPMMLSAPVPADVLDDDPVTQELPAVGDVLVAGSRESLFTPPPRGREPVYLMPEQPAVQDALAVEDSTAAAEPTITERPAEAGDTATAEPAAPRKGTAKKKWKVRREHHYDWLWELVGFLICVAIAMIVFFSIPSIVSP